MDKKSKEALRRYKKSRQAQSSSSSSSDDSGSSSSSSYSSDHKERRRKKKARLAAAAAAASRRSSSSSGDERKKQQMLEAKRNQIKRKLKEAKLKKRAAAAAAALSGHSHRPLSPGTQAKIKKLAERKHQRAASKERREREREKLRAAAREREREHHRGGGGSRSPAKITKIRIHQDVKARAAKSPPRMHHQLMTREKIIIQARTRERTPSPEQRQRHEHHKMRHDEMARDRDRRERDRERAEREAARDKERAEALARCQERQRERERLAREKLRREEEDKKYGGGGGGGAVERPDRMMAVAARAYGSRERSMDLLTKREREAELYERERGLLDRDELRREREYLAVRRRDLSPTVEHYGRRDPRDLYTEEEERARAYRERAYMEEARHPRDRDAWLEAREMRERELHDVRDLRDYREMDRDLMYADERLERGRGDWNMPRERDWDDVAPSRGAGGFIGGPKRPPTAAGPSKIQRDHRAPSEPDWDLDELKTVGSGGGGVGSGGAGSATGSQPSKSEAAHLRDDGRGPPYNVGGAVQRDPWMEHDQRELPSTGAQREKGGPPPPPLERRWQPEWRDPDADMMGGRMPGVASSHMHPMHHRGGRGFRRGVGPPGPQNPNEHLERNPSAGSGGSGYSRPLQPPPLMTLPVQPPNANFHGGGGGGVVGVGNPRFAGKRNMTYTNPTIIKKQQAAAAAAKAAAQASAATVVAAVKAAAHSVANATTNAGILAQVTGAGNTAQSPSAGGGAAADNKPEAGEILNEAEPVPATADVAMVVVAATETEGGAELDKPGGELSEISDSDDEILNNTDKKSDDIDEPTAAEPLVDAGDGGNTGANEKAANVVDTESAAPPNSELVAVPDEHVGPTENPAEDDEMLDFEEISDGELEEDARNKGVGDALGVDWASLIAETKKQAAASASTQANEQPTTAKQKWQPHRIILDMGVSLKMAGSAYAKKLLSDAQCRLDEELTEFRVKTEIKEELSSTADEDSQSNFVGNTALALVKDEGDDGEPPLTARTNVDNLPALACIQVAQRLHDQQRRKLIVNACGANSRALSARQDLKLRRQLCRLPARECNIPRPVPQTSNKMKAMAMQVFLRALEVK